MHSNTLNSTGLIRSGDLQQWYLMIDAILTVEIFDYLKFLIQFYKFVIVVVILMAVNMNCFSLSLSFL